MDTIFALASARGKAGVSVIRISGDAAFRVGEKLCGALPEARGVRTIRGDDGLAIDEALVLCFREGHSFTGEAGPWLRMFQNAREFAG